jgi:hypothetical protein
VAESPPESPSEADGDLVDEDFEYDRVPPPKLDFFYLGEASLLRPVMPGDVFREIPVPGCTEEEASANLTIIVDHPSAMRDGAELKSRVRAAPLIVKPGLNREKFVKRGYFDCFQMPGLADVAKANEHEIDEGPWAAQLAAAAPVASAALDLRKRIACLDRDGVCYLLHCVSHSNTRIAVKVQSVFRKVYPKLVEIDQLEDWNEALVDPPLDESEREYSLFNERLLDAATEFETFVNETQGSEGITLRQMFAQLGELPVGEDTKARAGVLVADANAAIQREIAARRHARLSQHGGVPVTASLEVTDMPG